jgi:hypothetical protein
LSRSRLPPPSHYLPLPKYPSIPFCPIPSLSPLLHPPITPHSLLPILPLLPSQSSPPSPNLFSQKTPDSPSRHLLPIPLYLIIHDLYTSPFHRPHNTVHSKLLDCPK